MNKELHWDTFPWRLPNHFVAIISPEYKNKYDSDTTMLSAPTPFQRRNKLTNFHENW
jgi:hypothetical protein